jgi:hypothetical protein
LPRRGFRYEEALNRRAAENRKRKAGVALLIAVFATQCLAAADPKPVSPGENLDELVIRAKRLKLREMRTQIVEVEDRFYAKYNELNTNDDYDIHCREYTPTGSISKDRVCRASFEERLDVHYARDVMRMMDGEGTVPPPQDPDRELLEKYTLLRKHALKVINANPELRRMVREREALDKAYNEEQKIRLNGRVYVLE